MSIFQMLEVGTNGAVNLAALLIIVASIIQISPIQINPWDKIASSIGRAFHGDILKRIDNVEQSVKDLRSDIQQSEAIHSRVRILRFNDELLQNRKHTKDSFDQVLTDIQTYENYCNEHKDFRNGVTTMSIGNIKRCYDNCLKEHDFL